MDENTSVLVYACSIETVKHLLEEEGQNGNFQDDTLLEASSSGSLDTVKLLLKKMLMLTCKIYLEKHP